jgi:hypothetical protein
VKLLQIPIISQLVEAVLHSKKWLDRLRGSKLTECPPGVNRSVKSVVFWPFIRFGPLASDFDERRNVLRPKCELCHIVRISFAPTPSIPRVSFATKPLDRR